MRACVHTVAVLAAATVAAGCGSELAQAPGGDAAQASPVVGCEDGGRMSSPLTDADRRSSIVAHPLTFVYARQQSTQPAADLDSTRQSLRRLIEDPSSRERERRLARRTLEDTRPGSYGAATMRIRVRAGEQATVTVPAEHRADVSLIYTARARDRENPAAQGAYRADDGDPAVTFRACPDEEHRVPRRVRRRRSPLRPAAHHRARPAGAASAALLRRRGVRDVDRHAGRGPSARGGTARPPSPALHGPGVPDAQLDRL